MFLTEAWEYKFGDFDVWGFLLLIFVILSSLLVGNCLRRTIKPLRKILIPASVIGGIILLIISSISKVFLDESFFDTKYFNNNGIKVLEIITYHCLGIGFVSMALKTSDKKFTKEKNGKIFDSGVLTVGTYLLQAIVGLVISIIFVLIGSKLTFKSAGVLLPFGYGQGTGQAMNYGNLFETEFGFVGGKSFGLAVAALGFLSAAIGGVIYMNILKKKGKIKVSDGEIKEVMKLEDYEAKDEIASTESIDKLTIQFAIVIGTYLLAFFLMKGISVLIKGTESLIFGFNFLIGTLMAILVKNVVKWLRKKNIIKQEYISNYFMNRIGGFAFDIMIVSGIAAIQIDILLDYLVPLLVMAFVGAVATLFYVLFVSKKLFSEYQYEQFFVMYGMLTGTASTGIILLREIDPKFETDASDNMVYQTIPAIALGFPILLIPNFIAKSDINTYISFGLIILLFGIMNLILFRRSIFKKKHN